MSFVAEAFVETPNGAKYAKQLAKHWAHNLAVEEAEDRVLVTFPKDARGADWPDSALVTFTPTSEGLSCHIRASAEGQRNGLKGAVERHIDRFAFREAPLTYNWEYHDE